MRLRSAWTIYFGVMIFFVVFVEVSHRLPGEFSVSYQYRILIDKRLVADGENKKLATEKGKLAKSLSIENPSFPSEASSNVDDGRKRSIRWQEEAARSGSLLIVLVDDEKAIRNIDSLGNKKAIFIIPHYLKNFKEVVKKIHEAGCDFLLQIPTQSSTPSGTSIGPFQANAPNNLDKLYRLLAVDDRAVGVANITPTLFTKSITDMEKIRAVLEKRGLIFLDLADCCVKSEDGCNQSLEKSAKSSVNPAILAEEKTAAVQTQEQAAAQMTIVTLSSLATR
ncbi:MAG: divergent polysaccharide deacetylase family protein [Holosporaceae bacterium]|jgi:hypothetical protein|nr:divergent polysaccharide deacetylase family protein [Holosporaceae bacterium]